MAEAPVTEITTIGMIEDAMLNAIRSQDPEVLGYRLKEIESYGGQLDDGLDIVVRSFPAVWVTFGGSDKPQKLGAEKWKVPVTMITLVGSRNIRGERATRKGSVGEVGTYQLLRDVFDLMALQDFDLPIERLEPGKVATLFSTRLEKKAVSVFSQEWRTAFVTRLKKPEDAEWLTLGIKYFLKPGDDNADAEDDLTLEAP